MSRDSTRVLVTGGAGFVGTWVVKLLARAHPEYKITVTDLKHADEYTPPVKNVQYIQADITKPVEASNAVEWSYPDVIVHTAGWVPQGYRRYARRPQDIDFIQKVNVQGTANMLDAAKEFGVKVFVHTSSCTVITDDLDHDYPNHDETIPFPSKSLIYGESKARAEALALAGNTPSLSVCALRPSVILGPEDYQLIPSVHACIAKGETPFIIGDGNNLYDFTYVENIAHAHVLAIENLLTTKTAAGHAFFITNQQPVTFRDFCLAVWAAFGHTPRFSVSIPANLAWALGLAADWVSWIRQMPFTLSAGSVKDGIGTRYASQVKAKEILGYTPLVDLWEGIKITCEAYQQRLDAQRTAGQDPKTNGSATKFVNGKAAANDHPSLDSNGHVNGQMEGLSKRDSDSLSDEGYASDPMREQREDKK